LNTADHEKPKNEEISEEDMTPEEALPMLPVVSKSTEKLKRDVLERIPSIFPRGLAILFAIRSQEN
jgi:hypothetical protein